MVDEFPREMGRQKKKSLGMWPLGRVSRWKKRRSCKEWKLEEDLREPAHWNGIDFPMSIMMAFSR